ncbi:MAG: hypothetical protein GY722_28680 [bacterium]|nr:hypothetical protein [bacterium]
MLLRAFEIIRERDYPLTTAKEDEITTALRAVIENDLRQKGSVSGFSRSTFETVIRQSQVTNFDGSKPGKSPDLCFKLRDDEEEPRPVLSEHEALFVECKRIEKKKFFAGSWYCDDGLSRFVDGDYAWAMEQGLMLGYARHQRTITGHLIPAMQQPERLERLNTAQLPRMMVRRGAEARNHAEALYVSRHRRDFSWVDGKGPATEILIYHSWHDCG